MHVSCRLSNPNQILYASYIVHRTFVYSLNFRLFQTVHIETIFLARFLLAFFFVYTQFMFSHTVNVQHDIIHCIAFDLVFMIRMCCVFQMWTTTEHGGEHKILWILCGGKSARILRCVAITISYALADGPCFIACSKLFIYFRIAFIVSVSLFAAIVHLVQ